MISKSLEENRTKLMDIKNKENEQPWQDLSAVYKWHDLGTDSSVAGAE